MHTQPPKQACSDTLPMTVQVLALNNERFMVPEVLFQPTDVGLQQAGLPQTIVEVVQATPPELHPLLYSNVLCTGGCATLPGFRERLYNELRALVPDDYEVSGPPQVHKALCVECAAKSAQEALPGIRPLVPLNFRGNWSCLETIVMALRDVGQCQLCMCLCVDAASSAAVPVLAAQEVSAPPHIAVAGHSSEKDSCMMTGAECAGQRACT